MVLNIATDYSEFTGLRHCDISDNSGEDFYHRQLNGAFYKAYTAQERLTVILDGGDGYASSFLDEAFGNLVYDFTLKVVNNHITIVSEQEPHWKDMLISKTFEQWEQRRREKKKPKVTADHTPWFRFVDNSLKQEVWEKPVTSV